MIKRLSDLLPGEEAVITGVGKRSDYRQRLMEMGLRVGGRVMMRRDAPLGDPMEISIMGYNISLRKSEARQIIIDTSKEIV